jgi:DNA polymerase/3'-5' exonuclease PolX
MSEVQNRLENSKGGSKTQALQKEIVKKLDDLIKQTEDEMNKQNQSSQSAAGKQQQAQPTPDSKIMQGEGKGEVQNKKLIQSSEVWGKMPEKEKIKAMEALSRQLPPHIREAAEGFSKKLGQQGKKP